MSDDIKFLIHERFERQAARTPHGLAIDADGAPLTYAELNAAANLLAREIVAQLGPAPTPVALLLELGAAQPLAIMATLKAGKFYVALDCTNPPARLAQLIADAGCRLLITNDSNLTLAQSLCATSGLVLLNLDERPAQSEASNLELALALDTPVCIAYTSGSTGQPKGVIRTHRTESRSITRRTDKFGFGSGDRFVYHTNYGFAMSFAELFCSLLNGAALCPYDIRAEGTSGLAAWLAEHRITIFNCVPSLFRRFLGSPDFAIELPQLRLCLVGGEPVYQRDIELFARRFASGCRLVNYLGLTEMAPIAFYEVQPARDVHETLVPIGYPEPDVEVRLLSEDGTEVRAGEIGELSLYSEYLSPGYWRQPGLTAAAFETDRDDSRRRVFRTGDLGRRRSDGCLEYLGRKDFQAKIRGQTVHPAEVEAALFSIPGIREAVVVTHVDAQAAVTRLVAYVVCSTPAAQSIRMLRVTLSIRLPNYMIPSAFVFLDAMPRSASGKPDRASLPPAEFGRSQLSAEYVAPRSRTERVLARLWAENLRVEPIGIEDDYFELGGDSLSAGLLLAAIGKKFGGRVTPAMLVEEPTITQLASRLDTRHAARRALTTVRHGAGLLPLFFVPGGAGIVLSYAAFLRQLDPAQPVYAFEAGGSNGRGPALRDVAQIAAAYIAELFSVQPAGPYLLAGECTGGQVAWEMAQQLRASGQEVALLALLDTQRTLHAEQRPRAVTAQFDLKAISRLVGGWTAPKTVQRRASHSQRRSFVAAEALRESVQFVRAYRASIRVDPYVRAVRAYHPSPYDGHVTLFINEAWFQSEPTLGWDGLARGGLTVRRLQGDHLTHLSEYGAFTARLLQEAINAAQPGMAKPGA